MAKKIVYDIVIESSDAQGSIKRVEERLNELNQVANVSQKEINTLQQELKDLGQTNSDKAVEGVQSLRREYRRLTEELQKTEEGTEKFNELAQAAGQVKDRIEDANDSISNFNKSPFENIKNNLSQLAGKIRDLDFDGFRQSSKDLSTNFLNLGKSFLGLDRGLSVASIGFRTLGAAIAATGIGLLVISIGILVRNFDTLKTSGGLIGTVFTVIGEVINALTTSVLKLSDALGLTSNAYENFKKKQNEANAETVKSAEEAAKEEADLREKYRQDDLTNEEKAFEALAKRRADELIFLKKDLEKEGLARQGQYAEIEFRLLAFEEETKVKEQQLRDKFADEAAVKEAEEARKAAEAAKKREQDRINILTQGFQDEKRLRTKQFEIETLRLSDLEYNAQIKLSQRLRDARLKSDEGILEELSNIFDAEFLIKQDNVEKLYQTEYAYYSDLYDIKDKLEQQIIAEEERVSKTPSKKDDGAEYLLDLRIGLGKIQEEINRASSDSVVRFVSLYKSRFAELVGVLEEPNIWNNAFKGLPDETEERFAQTENLARTYIAKLKGILSGGQSGLFFQGIGTESEARKLIADELAEAERVLDGVQTKRLNRAEKEISVIDRLTNQKRQLADTEKQSLQLEINGADERIRLLEKYGLQSKDIYQEALFQKQVAEKNFTDFLAREGDKRIKNEEEDAEKKKAANLELASQILNIGATLTNGISGLINQRYDYEIQRAGDNQEAVQKLQKQQFEDNKALGIVTTIISTAQAVVNALGTSGPPWVGIAMAAVVGALGAAQVAMIASQEFNPGGGGGGSSFNPNVQGSQTMAANVSAMQPNVNFAAAGSGANVQTAGGGSPNSVQFTGSISVSEINNTQQLVSIYETGSILGGG
jgi:hypothetical protein